MTYRNDGGEKKIDQKCLLLSTLKELHISFKEQNPDTIKGFSSFARLKPKCCLLAGSSGTHMVCVCSIHQNVKLLIIGNVFIAFFKRKL